MKDVLLLLAWTLPASRAKNYLLRRLGHDVAPTATAGQCLVWHVERIVMGPGSNLSTTNVVKNMKLVELGERAWVGRMNLFSSHPSFTRLYPEGGRLVLAADAIVTARHHFDCSGSITVGRLGGFAGHETKVMTHSIDFARNAQAAYPVEIGERSFVGARSLVMGGSVLPPRSVLAAGSLLRSVGTEQGLYAGSPARFKGPLEGAWFDRELAATTTIFIPDTGEIIETDTAATTPSADSTT